MEKKKEISPKSTKNEILDAYNDLLQKKEEEPIDRKTEKKREEEKEIVKGASQNSVEKIVKGLAEIKLGIGNSLDSLEEKLIKEFKRLTDLQQAIDVEKREIEDIHGIRVTTDSLAALLQAQKEKKTQFEIEIEEKKKAFDEEITRKREQWKKDQEEYEFSKKEKEVKSKKEREREEEEYSYNLQLKRKKEKDEYEAKKAILEKELIEKRSIFEKEMSERGALITSKEKELEELRIKVAEFPKQLEKVVKETEKSILEKLEFKYKHQAELSEKEIEGERKLSKQIIAALEAKIKEQEQYFRQLNLKLDEAGKQVQNIAIKAIEGASSQRILTKNYENSVPKEPVKTQ